MAKLCLFLIQNSKCQNSELDFEFRSGMKQKNMRNLKVHIAKDHQEAEEYDLEQARRMSIEERYQALFELQRRVHGDDIVDVRKSGVVFKGIQEQ